MVLEFESQTIHPIENFISMNLLQMSHDDIAPKRNQPPSLKKN